MVRTRRWSSSQDDEWTIEFAQRDAVAGGRSCKIDSFYVGPFDKFYLCDSFLHPSLHCDTSIRAIDYEPIFIYESKLRQRKDIVTNLLYVIIDSYTQRGDFNITDKKMRLSYFINKLHFII